MQKASSLAKFFIQVPHVGLEFHVLFDAILLVDETVEVLAGNKYISELYKSVFG